MASSTSAVAYAIRKASNSPVEFMQRIESGGKNKGRFVPSFLNFVSSAPVIIFVEDFDLFAGVRGKFIHTNKQDHEAFINQLLVELDGFEKQEGVVLMATTRNLKQIDEALQRPGRMDRIFHLQRPTQAEREKILQIAGKETIDDELIDFIDWRKIHFVLQSGHWSIDEEVDAVVTKLKPYFRKYEYPKKAAPSFYQVTNNSKERPDVWVDSPETERVLQRYTRSPLVNELVPHSQFWDAEKTVRQVKDIYKRINGQSLSHATDSSEGERNWGSPSDVLSELVAAGEKGIYALSALGGTLFYLKQAFLDEILLRFAKYEVLPCSGVSDIARKPYMVLYAAALENLEIFENSKNGGSSGTLYAQLNHCATAFGKRLLKTWLARPLYHIEMIKERQDAVAALKTTY